MAMKANLGEGHRDPHERGAFPRSKNVTDRVTRRSTSMGGRGRRGGTPPGPVVLLEAKRAAVCLGFLYVFSARCLSPHGTNRSAMRFIVHGHESLSHAALFVALAPAGSSGSIERWRHLGATRSAGASVPQANEGRSRVGAMPAGSLFTAESRTSGGTRQ